MNKEEIYALLDGEGIEYEITEHKAVYTMEELAAVECPHPEADAKNLFVRDDKRQSYYLITVKGDKRVDLKKFRREQGLRPLTFASEDELHDILGLYPGAVSPFGLLNAQEGRVTFFLDEELLQGDGLIGIHPNDNTATVWLRTLDLLSLLRRRGSPAAIITVEFHEKA